MGFPVDSFGNSMGFLWIFHDISIGFRKHVYEISAGFLWDQKDFYGISMVFLWYFHGSPVGFFFCWICMRLLWDSYGIFVIALGDLFGIPVGFP